MHIVRKHKIAFLALPKNASRTVSSTLKKIGGSTEGMGHHSIQPPTGDMRGYFAFAVVRNPFSRTVSKWFEVFKHIDTGDVDFRHQAFDAYVEGLRAGASGCGYNKFHLSVQSSVIDEAQKHFNKPIKIITYENLNSEWERLKFFNLVGKLPEKQVGKQSGGDGYGNWRLYYANPVTIDKVYSVFYEDFNRYGYSNTV
jgi:hypothetical protein